MKYLITERQLRLLSEQDDWWNKSSYDKGIWDKSTKTLENIGKMDPHTLATVTGIVSLFLPVIGPALSLGIGMADAGLYYKQGDKKTAGMLAMFPFLPIGKIAKLVPAVGRLGEKGMEQLAKKMGQQGQTLSQLEKEVVEGMAKNKEVLQQDLKKISDDLAKKSKSQTVLKLAPNPDWIYRWFSNNMNGMVAKLFEKINKLDKLPFVSKNVKIVNNGVLDSVERGVFKQRPIIEIEVKETGDRFLLYSSTGTGAPSLKQAGDWQLLAGWKPLQNNPKEIEWYIKSEATTQLTKGLNKWATELANFIKKNGPDALGK
jgi:hypothetical protein